MTREAVLLLGKSGASYSDIQKKFAVPKSTLSTWFSKAGMVQDRTKQLEHLTRARLLSAQAKHLQKAARVETANEAATEIAASLPLHRQDVGRALLAMLYWAEGGKQDGNMKFTNTDPVLARLFLSLLRRFFDIDEKRLRVAIHVHSYHDQDKVLSFWSKQLNIPKSQFWKIYVKKRSEDREYRRNFMGICHVHYASSAIQRELLALGRAIADQVEAKN